MKKLRIKAIVMGLIVNFVGSTVIGAVIGIVVGIVAFAEGTAGVNNYHEFAAYFYASYKYMLLTILAGSFFTFLGSYVAAIMAEGGEIINALAIGFIEIILSLSHVCSFPLLIILIQFIIPIPVSYLGGYLVYKKRNKITGSFSNIGKNST